MSILNKINIYWNDLWKGILIRLFSVLPIQKNKVVFRSYHGTKFDDNPKYISDKLLESGEDIDIVWIVNDPEGFVNEKVRFVKEDSICSIFELATAKVWVDNVRKDIWVAKRKKQYYIQTWHGSTALKKIEKDAEDKLGKSYLRRAKLDSKIADTLVSGSKWNTELYKRSFWFKGDILETGAPRSDVFYSKNEKIIENVKKKYHISNEERIVLYAPTFRNDASASAYDINYANLLESLTNNWGGKWKLIIRMHPNCLKAANEISFTDNIINGSFYPDINELIIASSLLITDYSSCMFDALEANKRVIIYASDISEYMDERGFYFQFKELPFDVCTNTEELDTSIKTFDEDKYINNIQNFRYKIGLFSDGHSSERVASHIRRIMFHK